MQITRRELILGSAALGACSLAPTDTTFHPQTFDICVIGSGFAGTFLGLRTASVGLQTVLVEAGVESGQTSDSEKRLVDSFQSFNSGETEFGVSTTRVITLGGTSDHWGGVMSRLWPEDFELRSRYGVGVDWPISYEDLEPYYCEAEALLLTRGHPLVVGAEPDRRCPYPSLKTEAYVAPEVRIEGIEMRWFPIARSRRGRGAIRLADEEVPRFAADSNGTLLKAHQATRLVSTDGATIDHLEARRADGSVVKIRARSFVVAAGPIESARLLLLSRSQWFPSGLGNRYDLVGRHFNCHPSHETRFERRPGVDLPSGQHRTVGLKEQYRRAGLNALHHQIDVGAERVTLRIQPELEARFENRVSLLEGTADLFGNPLPDVHLSFSRRDELTFSRSRKALAEMRRRYGLTDRKASNYRRWRGHPAGTCRAANDERHGVVDSHLRVFGVENLYVSGAAAFPTSGTANPTNTVVALTLRLADHLTAGLARA